MAKTPKNVGGLTKKHWFGYMFGDMGGCMTFALMGTLFTLYCTNALGIDPALLGTLVIIWTIWDAVNDPMMGALMDKMFAKKQDKRGKFRHADFGAALIFCKARCGKSRKSGSFFFNFNICHNLYTLKVRIFVIILHFSCKMRRNMPKRSISAMASITPL